MLLRRRHKPHDDQWLPSHLWPWQGTQPEGVRQSNNATGQFVDVSRISAKMVELSLQQGQRDVTLRGEVPNKLAPVTWPFLWTSADIQRITQPPVENAGRVQTVGKKAAVHAAANLNPQRAQVTPPESAPAHLRARGTPGWTARCWNRLAALRSLRGYWNSVEKDQKFATYRERILGRLRLAAQYIEAIRQRIAPLIAQWNRRRVKTFQFITAQNSACATSLAHSKPLLRLRHACSKIRMLMVGALGGALAIRKFAHEYHCRDCGGKVGFRLRPHNLMERYFLPLLLTQEVRCADCFRQDYCLIFTRVRERSFHPDTPADEPDS